MDDVIDPADTRRWILTGLKALPPVPASGQKLPVPGRYAIALCRVFVDMQQRAYSRCAAAVSTGRPHVVPVAQQVIRFDRTGRNGKDLRTMPGETHSRRAFRSEREGDGESTSQS